MYARSLDSPSVRPSLHALPVSFAANGHVLHSQVITSAGDHLTATLRNNFSFLPAERIAADIHAPTLNYRNLWRFMGIYLDRFKRFVPSRFLRTM